MVFLAYHGEFPQSAGRNQFIIIHVPNPGNKFPGPIPSKRLVPHTQRISRRAESN